MSKCCFIESKPCEDGEAENDKHTIKIRKIKIKHVKETKFLGVTIDENLNLIKQNDKFFTAIIPWLQHMKYIHQ